MKYFIDTEFIEGFVKPLFGKKRHFIDLISIGIVCEDGRTYSAISNEYRYRDANDWVKENVIVPLYVSTVHGDQRNKVEAGNFHVYFGKSNKQIANEIKEFCKPQRAFEIQKPITIKYSEIQNPEFYGYYSDYDWVVFCSLFGTMMDLPKGFPMYCIDLKQTLDEKCQTEREMADYTETQGHTPSHETLLEIFKAAKNYPKQSNEHCALDDAKWNFDLYKFLNSIP